MLKTTPQNYGRLLFVITNPKNLKKKPPAGPLSAACGRTRLWTTGRAGSREKRPENEKMMVSEAPSPLTSKKIEIEIQSSTGPLQSFYVSQRNRSIHSKGLCDIQEVVLNSEILATIYKSTRNISKIFTYSRLIAGEIVSYPAKRDS